MPWGMYGAPPPMWPSPFGNGPPFPQFPMGAQTPPYVPPSFGGATPASAPAGAPPSASGVPGMPPGMGGINFQDLVRQARMQSLFGGLTGLGGNLIAAGQSGLTPAQRGAFISRGTEGFQQGLGGNDPFKAMLLMAQLQKVGQGPASVQEYEYAKANGFKGSYEDFKKIGSTAPSNVQEYEYYSKLPQDQKDAYLTMKRANPWINLGGSMALPSQTQPAGPPLAQVPKTLPPEELPATKQAQALGTGRGKTQAETEAGAPKALNQTEQMIGSIDAVLKDPNLPISTGFMSKLSFVPGTPQYDFTVKVKQLQGQAFLQAYESLKGGGVITEVEGTKATQAMARLDQAQSETAFRSALEEMRGVLTSARDRIQKQMPPQAGTGKPAQADPLGIR